MGTGDLLELERVYKALADANRLRILGLLRTGEICVCDIHESLDLPQSKVSRHLAYLRQAGLVHARKAGLWVHYRLAASPNRVVQQVVESALHAVAHQQTAARDLTRLTRRADVQVDALPASAVFACCAPGKARSTSR